MKKRLFIGSSSEELETDKKKKKLLENDFEASLQEMKQKGFLKT